MSDMYTEYMVDMLRDVEKLRILENPAYITVNVRETKNNGFGVQIPDLSKQAVPYELGPVRIAPMITPVLERGVKEDVGDISNAYVIVASYDATWLTENLVFAWNGMKFRTFKPTLITRYGEIIAINARLKNMTSDATASISTIALAGTSIASTVIGG